MRAVGAISSINNRKQPQLTIGNGLLYINNFIYNTATVNQLPYCADYPWLLEASFVYVLVLGYARVCTLFPFEDRSCTDDIYGKGIASWLYSHPRPSFMVNFKFLFRQIICCPYPDSPVTQSFTLLDLWVRWVSLSWISEYAEFPRLTVRSRGVSYSPESLRSPSFSLDSWHAEFHSP